MWKLTCAHLNDCSRSVLTTRQWSITSWYVRVCLWWWCVPLRCAAPWGFVVVSRKFQAYAQVKEELAANPRCVCVCVCLCMWVCVSLVVAVGRSLSVIVRRRRRRHTGNKQHTLTRTAAWRSRYNGFPHWSKVEVGDYGLEEKGELGEAEEEEEKEEEAGDAGGATTTTEARLARMRERYAARFPTVAFDHVRACVRASPSTCGGGWFIHSSFLLVSAHGVWRGASSSSSSLLLLVSADSLANAADRMTCWFFFLSFFLSSCLCVSLCTRFG